MRIVGCFMIVLASSVIAGCGSKRVVNVHPVSGQVVYGGKPARGVHVYFYPTSAPTVPDIPSNPHGVTGSDGRFTLTTFTEGDGAAEGGYQVILLWPEEKKDDEEDTDSDRFLGWHNAVHSKLTAKVTAGQNTIPAFKLATVSRPPAAVEGIPGRN